MKKLSRLPLMLLLASLIVFSNCSIDDGPQETPEEIQNAKLVGTWVPGTVVHEIDGDITDDRFAGFSIKFIAGTAYNFQKRRTSKFKQYTIVNPGGEAFEEGHKDFEYVNGNLNRIKRIYNGFEFDIALSNGDTKLKITLEVEDSGSPLGRASKNTGRYTFNLIKL